MQKVILKNVMRQVLVMNKSSIEEEKKMIVKIPLFKACRSVHII